MNAIWLLKFRRLSKAVIGLLFALALILLSFQPAQAARPASETAAALSVGPEVQLNSAVMSKESVNIVQSELFEPPYNVMVTPSTVDENKAIGTTVGTLSSTSSDTYLIYSYALVSGTGDTDNSSFTISQRSLLTAAVFDFETKSTYSIRVRITNNSNESFEKALTITIKNVNEAPTKVILSPSTINENMPAGTVVGNLGTTDPDGADIFKYEMVTGTGSTDNGSFTLSTNKIMANASFNYEAKKTYSIRVRSTDSSLLFVEEALTVWVRDVNEAPQNLSLSYTTVAENSAVGTTIGTFAAADPEGNALSYSLVAGDGSAHNNLFKITGTTLTVGALIDYETVSLPTIRVRVTDSGGLYSEKIFTLKVTNVAEKPTDITLLPASIAENKAVGSPVGALSCTDPEGGAFTFSLVSGSPNAGLFSIGTLNGAELQTAAAFDYETVKTFNVTIRCTDSTNLYMDKVFVVTVTDVNEAPTDIALSGASVPENAPAGTSAGTFSAMDPDANPSFTYTLAAGAGDADNASFKIEGTVLKTAAPFDYETKSAYNVRVRVSDGSLVFEKVFAVQVTNVNEPPTALALNPATVDENVPIGTEVGTLTATDPDSASFIFGLTDAQWFGDNSNFQVKGNKLLTNALMDFETKASYQIKILVFDETSGMNGMATQTFTISLRDLPDGPKPPQAPTDITLSKTSIDENLPERSAVGTLAAVDPDTAAGFTFTLVPAAANNSLFEIAGDQLLVRSSFNYEAGGTYTVRVKVVDPTNLSFEKSMTVTVNDLNETPAFTSLTNNTVPANALPDSVVGQVQVSDPDQNETLLITLSEPSSLGAQLFKLAGARLLVAADLTAYQGQNIEVKLLATDKGGLSATAVYQVSVLPAKQLNFTVSLPFITR